MRRERLQEMYSISSVEDNYRKLSRSVPRYPGGRAVKELFYQLKSEENGDIKTERTFNDYADAYAQFVIDYASERGQPINDAALKEDPRLLGAGLSLLQLESHYEEGQLDSGSAEELRAHIATLAAEFVASPWELFMESDSRRNETSHQMTLRLADVALFATGFTGEPHDSYRLSFNDQPENDYCAHAGELTCPRCSLRELYLDPVRHVDSDSPTYVKQRADGMLQAAVLSKLEGPADAAVLAEKLYTHVE